MVVFLIDDTDINKKKLRAYRRWNCFFVIAYNKTNIQFSGKVYPRRRCAITHNYTTDHAHNNARLLTTNKVQIENMSFVIYNSTPRFL